jgi:NADH:ubiquinone oxidoreductase subunit K
MITGQIAGITATVLLFLGIWGVLKARDLLRILLSVMLLLSSATLLAVTLSQIHTDPARVASSQAIVLLAWAIEVIEIVIALALFIGLARKGIKELSRLREYRW